jgi:Ca2+-binding RTX toxin-like protein
MLRRRRNPLSILGLVASDASYFEEGQREIGDLLSSLPDSAPADEHGFPQSLWLSIDRAGNPFTDNRVFVGTSTTHGISATVINFPNWRVVSFIEGQGTGFGATIYRLGETSEYLVAMRGTDGPNATDWFQNLSFSSPAWIEHRDELMRRLFEPIDGVIPAKGIIHFTGQSLGGGLAQYAAYEFVRLAKEKAAEPAQPGQTPFVYHPDRVTLTTFNAFAGAAGLMEIYDGRDGRTLFDPGMLAGVQTAHYAVANELVHRLGAVMEHYSEEVDGVLQPRSRLKAGYGHLNGDGNTYLLDFRQPGASDDDPQGYLNTIDAHRIEKGFYQGFDTYQGDFEASSRLSRYEIDYLDLSNAQWVASRFSRLFMSSKPELSDYGAGVRLVLGLASGIALGNPFQTATLISAGIEAAYKQGSVSRLGQIALEAVNLATVFLSMTVPALRIGRLFFTALDVFRDLSTQEKRQALELISQTIDPTRTWSIDVPGEPSPWTDAERAIRYERAARVLAATAALRPDQRVAYINDAQERERVQLLSRLDIDPDEFHASLDRTDWLTASNEYLMELGYSAGFSPVELTDLGLQLTQTMADEGARYAAFDPALAGALEVAKGDFILTSLGRAIANASRDFTAKYADAATVFGTSVLDFQNYQPIHDALESAMADPRYAAIREDIARALGIADHAAQKVALQQGLGRDPFLDRAFQPDAAPTQAQGLTEGMGKIFTLYLAYAAGSAGQHVALQLTGIDPRKVSITSLGEVVPVSDTGEFALQVAEGQRETTFLLNVAGDIDQSAAIAISAQLVDGTGAGTHGIHLEATLPVTAIVEAGAQIQTFGVDGSETLDAPLSADAGDGNDWLNALLEVDEFGDRVPTPRRLLGGDGNDWIVGGFGPDLIYGGPGDDYLHGLVGQDRLYGGEGDDVMFALEFQTPWPREFEGYSVNEVWRMHYADWYFERVPSQIDDPLNGVSGRNTVYLRVTGYDGPPPPDGRAGGLSYLYRMNDGLLEPQWMDGGPGADFIGGAHGPDFLDGGEGDDQIQGFGGDDVIIGGEGDDVLFGNDGDDYIEGGLGADWMNGGAGRDILIGGEGADELQGSADGDWLYGGDGADKLFGDLDTIPPELHGSDFLDGGAGDDELTGHGGADTLYGGPGDDVLVGDHDSLPLAFHGDDLLDGGEGNDRLSGGGGADTLLGGPGDDEIQAGPGDDLAEGGPGADLLFGEDGDDVLYGNDGDDWLEGGAGADRLFGGDGADGLRGDAGDDDLHGDDGDDQLEGNAGDDRLYGGAGTDLLDGGDGADLLDGGAGVDQLEGGDGDDVYLLRPGDSPAGGALEVIVDTGGRDTVRILGVGAGAISVRRNGTGGDIVLSYGPTDEVIIEGGLAGSIETYEIGGARVGWQTFLGRTLQGEETVTTTVPGAMVTGGTAADTLTATGGGAIFSGGAGDDVLIGAGGSNTYLYNRGDGADTIHDTGGDAAAPNRIVFGAGIAPEDLRLSTGSLRIAVGFDPRDSIRIASFDPDDALGQRAIDRFEFADGTSLTYEQLLARGFDIEGAATDDVLAGTNVQDRLYGGRGNDTLRGGAGSDTYLFGFGHGQDTIEETSSATDLDVLAFWAGVSTEDVTVDRLDNDLLVELSGSPDRVRVRDHFAGRGIERFEFADGTRWDAAEIAARVPNRLTEGPDTYTGSPYADTIFGLGGADRLYGMAGDDLIDGGPGADMLYGGAGTDTLIGGPGDDTLDGGPGSDTYRFGRGDGRDTIASQDATAGKLDVLEFWDSKPDDVALRREWYADSAVENLWFELLDPNCAPSGDSVRIDQPFAYDDNTRMVDRVAFADGSAWSLADIRTRLTTATDGDDRIRGFAGDDVLEGGAGDDELAGFFGDDVLRGGPGADRLWGEWGADTLEGGPGPDRLAGGHGNDLYLYNVGDGSDVIADGSPYGDANDVLRFGPGILPGDLVLYRTDDFSSMYADLSVIIGTAAQQIRIDGFYGYTGAIEAFEFDDGTRWTRADIDARTIVGIADVQTGTAGDDTFVVDHEWDVIVESPGGGNDTVLSALSYRLPANVENLTLTGLLDSSGTGNELANVIRGNAGSNRLEGGGGADTLIGGAGDDWYVGPGTIVELPGEGFDTWESNSYDITLPENVERLVAGFAWERTRYDSTLGYWVNVPRVLTGNAADNVIDASAAQHVPVILDGGPGADVLIGHNGDDTYRVDDPGDRVVERSANGGFDTVEASIDYTLAPYLERLVLTGSAPISGTGNAAANTLDGSRNPAANALRGGRGDDDYILGAGDVAIELPGEGVDTVLLTGGAVAEYRVSDFPNIEGLALADALGASSLVGDAGPNPLTGNRYANRIEGGAGADTMAGGDGGDTYVTGRRIGTRREVAVVDEDRILDIGAAGSAPDTIVVEALSPDLGPLIRDANDLVLQFARRTGDPDDDVLFERVRVVAFFLGTTSQVERLRFGDGAEISLIRLADAGYDLTATTGTATGGPGADRLSVAGAATALYGGPGDDLLLGNAAANFLQGDAGNDRLLGGDGDDRYSFSGAFGRDWVEDTGGFDSLEFSDERSTTVAGVTRNGDRIALAFTSGASVVINGGSEGGGIERVHFADGVIWDAAALESRAVAGTLNVQPFANAPLAPQGAVEDAPFSYSLPSDLFIDLDPGDALTYSVAPLFGGPLPGWLAFDAQSRTLSGTPGDDAFGAVWLAVTATDAAGATAQNTLILEITGVNDAPVVLSPVGSLTVPTGETTYHWFQPGTFFDLDVGDILTFSGALVDGTALPSWLQLNGGTIVATPAAADIGLYAIRLTATDRAGASATTLFDLSVVRPNNPPRLASALPDRTATEDAAFSYQFAVNAFTDPDVDDRLTYSATRAGGGPLPAWLSFDAAERRFSGVPGNSDVGGLDIVVTATDLGGMTANDTFRITVSNVNDPPQVLAPSSAAAVEEGRTLAYLAGALFTDIDAGDSLSFSALLASGAALPSWLKISTTTGTLSGTPAIGAIGTLDVRVSAKDKAGATATLPVLVTVFAAPPQTLIGNSSANTLTGKSGDDRLDGKAGGDTMRGGLGNDTYVVDNTGDKVEEAAGAGSDLVEASITYSVSSLPNVEHIVLTGTGAINATGNSGNNMLRGNAAKNTLAGGGGIDVLQGLAGDDTLGDSGGNGLLDGGPGNDSLTGNSARQLFIGGTGNDVISTGGGADILAFNAGHGQDTVNASTGLDDVVSLGRGIDVAALFLSKSGNNLVLETGGSDRVTFKDWYASSSNRSVSTLQVIAPATADADARVDRYNFAKLVQSFDAARAASATLARWQMMDKLLDAHLATSDTEALGGDLAHRYGATGSLAGVGFDAAAAILGAASFAVQPQALQPAAALETGTHRLV